MNFKNRVKIYEWIDLLSALCCGLFYGYFAWSVVRGTVDEMERGFWLTIYLLFSSTIYLFFHYTVRWILGLRILGSHLNFIVVSVLSFSTVFYLAIAHNKLLNGLPFDSWHFSKLEGSISPVTIEGLQVLLVFNLLGILPFAFVSILGKFLVWLTSKKTSLP